MIVRLGGFAIGGLGALTPTAIAQVIPSSDQTQVRPNPETGATFDITGGSVSRDGVNLFHDFQTFDLNLGDVANFATAASIERILSTISGGEPSRIDGLLRVTGSQADLYLLNPAGLIFGDHAQLDVPGSFWAMTADRVAFGDRELNVLASNDYGTLIGVPTGFGFSAIEPAAIVNFAAMDSTGGSVGLVGGTVASTGNLTARDAVQIVTVPGSHWLRLDVPGQILGLEFDPMAIEALTAQTVFTPRSLSDLLVGTTTTASRLTVAADGTVSLVGTSEAETLPIEAGDLAIAASTITADRVQLNADRNLIATTSTIDANHRRRPRCP
ncbi:MAG: filamentous hemagglutinin N-terminal domain-containing protein [Coleofasciculaceae cyanobacterium RL_1_1]|nr:filamentous hemagglutinin N-terminal domain-containing protein [Coleofasciculaceae cyanobacterium RL_1_1]